MLGMGDVIEADYFAERAMLIAEDLGNPYELGICRLQQASVKTAANQHAAAMASGQQAVDLFESIDAKSNLRLAYYRLAPLLLPRQPQARGAAGPSQGR